MQKIQKTHLIYAIISIFAVLAYSGFLIRNSIEEVDTREETLPYSAHEEFNIPTVTEPPTRVIAVNEEVTGAPKFLEIPSESEEETEIASTESVSTGFSPILPVKGNIIKNFSEKHVYNEKTKDWRNHMGIDISSTVAGKVLSCEDGTVTACYIDPMWGNVIEIDHGEYISVYKNVSTLIMVKEGDSVRKGESISGVGDSAPLEKYPSAHLHFEMLHYGEYIDPLSVSVK